MALIVVNLTDTFEDWRTKTNTSISQIGDLASLTASNSASIVSALNGMLEEVKDDTSPELGGDLDVLTRSIVSSSNRNIAITPHGTGLAVITKGSFAGKLGSSLDVNGNAIVSVGAADVVITPDGTGDVRLETDKVKVGSSGEDATITTNGSGSLTVAPNDGGAGNPGIILENAGRILLNCVSGQPVIIDGDVTATSYTGDLTGTINTATTAATQLQSDNSTKVATTAWAKAYADAAVASEDTLEEMNDTVMSGKANLDILQFNGTNWINRTMTAAGIPTSGFTVAMAIALG